VDAIGARLRHELPLDQILVCAHDDADGCDCRKPKPGLILKGAAQFSAEVSRSFLIGDRWRDIEAGQAAGCRTVWIDRGYSERGPRQPADARVGSIGEAVDWIVGQIDVEEDGSQ
jgi:D-glycero-D-manno-heptose 1,7-bisphosphate phosphatase